MIVKANGNIEIDVIFILIYIFCEIKLQLISLRLETKLFSYLNNLFNLFSIQYIGIFI